MSYSVQHTAIGKSPFWYHLDSHGDLEQAALRARNYAMDHGGYVCVKDGAGKVVYGTDPAQLDRAILIGINRDFPGEAARRVGCCA